MEDVSKYMYGVKEPSGDTIYSNPISEYISKYSSREQPDVLRRLHEKTINEVERHRMITAPYQAQFVRMLLKLMNAKKVIEIGVYTGYNLLSMAMTIPKDGKVIGCDISAEYYEVGKPFFEEAGVTDKIDMRIQPALKTLDELFSAGEGGTFDFIYIDADKENYGAYYEKALQLLRPGGLVGVDNALWGGKVTLDEKDEETTAIHDLNLKIHKDERVDCTFLPIWDGLNLARKI